MCETSEWSTVLRLCYVQVYILLFRILINKYMHDGDDDDDGSDYDGNGDN